MNRKRQTSSVKDNPIVRNAIGIIIVLCVLLLCASLAMRFGTRHGLHRTVPDFTGISIDKAERAARSEGLKIIVNDTLYVPSFEGGTVLDQLPKGGVEVKAGRKVYVTVNSYNQKSVKVPYVAGRSLRQAKNMLESTGLEIARLEYVEDIATNYVLAEFLNGVQIHPESTLEAEIGTGVTLRVGVEDGYGTAAAPKLIGTSLARAKSRIWDMGLNVGRVTYDADVDRLERGNARVYYQSVPQGRHVMLGTSVDIKLTLDSDKIAENEAASESDLQRYLKEQAEAERLYDSLRRMGISPDGEQDDDDEFFQ